MAAKFIYNTLLLNSTMPLEEMVKEASAFGEILRYSHPFIVYTGIMAGLGAAEFKNAQKIYNQLSDEIKEQVGEPKLTEFMIEGVVMMTKAIGRFVSNGFNVQKTKEEIAKTDFYPNSVIRKYRSLDGSGRYN